MGHSQVPRVLALINVLPSLKMGAPVSGLGLCLGSEVGLGSDLASASVGFAACALQRSPMEPETPPGPAGTPWPPASLANPQREPCDEPAGLCVRL